MRTVRFLTLALALPAACSTSSSTSADGAPSTPRWVDAPAAVELYEGRETSIPMTIETADASAVHVSVVNAEGVTGEAIPMEGAPAGTWRGTLRVRAGYGALPSELQITTADGAPPVAVPVHAHALAWLSRLEWKSGPIAREHGVFLLAPDGKAAFLLHGGGYSPWTKPIEDAWQLDLPTGMWTQWTPTGDAPAAGLGRRIAPGETPGVAYVHGGSTGFEETTKLEDEVLRMDVTNLAHTFTRLTNVGAPPPRTLHAFAYDTASKRFAIFAGIVAGFGGGEALGGDTWLGKLDGDTVTWSALKGDRSPKPRYGAFHAFDAESHRLVVWSGGGIPAADGGANPAEDAWALDLSTETASWTKLAVAGTAPRGRRNGCAMHDPIGRRLFVYGGTYDGKTSEPGLWALDLVPGREGWTRLDLADAPPLRSSGFGFSTAEGHVACAFGNDASPYSDVNVVGYR